MGFDGVAIEIPKKWSHIHPVVSLNGHKSLIETIPWTKRVLIGDNQLRENLNKLLQKKIQAENYRTFLNRLKKVQHSLYRVLRNIASSIFSTITKPWKRLLKQIAGPSSLIRICPSNVWKDLQSFINGTPLVPSDRFYFCSQAPLLTVLILDFPNSIIPTFALPLFTDILILCQKPFSIENREEFIKEKRENYIESGHCWPVWKNEPQREQLYYPKYETSQL